LAYKCSFIASLSRQSQWLISSKNFILFGTNLL
jgi:hypothetical protein